MPVVIFQKFGELAASVAADEDGARAAHMDTLVQKLNIMTDMDVTTAHLILHFRQNADVAEEEKLEPADWPGSEQPSSPSCESTRSGPTRTPE